MMYGTNFTTKWNNIITGNSLEEKEASALKMKRFWIEELEPYNWATVAKALEHMKHEVPYAPTVPEFCNLCRQFRVHPEAPKLEHQAASPEEVLQTLDKIKIHQNRERTDDDNISWAKWIVRQYAIKKYPSQSGYEIAVKALNNKGISLTEVLQGA